MEYQAGYYKKNYNLRDSYLIPVKIKIFEQD
jgi:hypothetical protein